MNDTPHRGLAPQPSQVPIAANVIEGGPTEPRDPSDVATTPAPTVSSTSDARTINNVMRHEYKVLTEEEKLAMKTVKDLGLEFYNLIHDIGKTDSTGKTFGSRELAFAAGRVEEAVMWVVKHITG